MNPYDPEAVRIVEMAALCEAYHVLPYAGGLYQQPAYIVECLKLVQEAKAVRAKMDKLRADSEAQKVANASRG
jgi:hypothetical protein